MSKVGKTISHRDALANLNEEILHLLPSNDLLNFKRVCKDWNELISSQRFIQKHLERSKADCNGTLIVVLSSSGILVFDDPTGNRTIAYPSGFSFNSTEIVGSCDGLLCLFRLENEEGGDSLIHCETIWYVFAIMNPSTGKSDIIRITDGFEFNPTQYFWFGQHPSTGEYFILAIDPIKAMPMLAIPSHLIEFSSTLASLQELSIPSFVQILDERPILLHGALHWPGCRGIEPDQKFVILGYDIQKNKPLEISTPFEPPSYFILGIVEGCLFAIIRTPGERMFELWIMKEYGIEESWTKYDYIEGFEDCWSLLPLGFLADGDLLLKVANREIVKYSFTNEKKGTVAADNQKIVKYSLFEKKDTVADVHSNKFTINLGSAVWCADSLVSPAVVRGSSYGLSFIRCRTNPEDSESD